MSALAGILLEMGYRVSGSDLKESKITDRLREKGVIIHKGHHPDNVNDCHLAVYSTAIPSDNPELKEAAKKVPLWHRSQLLAALLNHRYGIAVAGAHGKTTTSSMLSLLLVQGGLDPTAVIGGEVNYFNGNARLGQSDYLVAEACESDNSFLLYQPRLSVVTNVEAEHLEYYGGNFSRLKEAYYQFLNNVKNEGKLVLNVEDFYLNELYYRLSQQKVTFAVEDKEKFKNADYTARQIEYFPRGSCFSLYYRNRKLGKIELSVPGRHNISNALAALSAASCLGIDPLKCSEILLHFKGAGRRFEVIGEPEGITVVDDYAHHPTEIRATLQAARNCGNNVIAIFQPHRYSRTAYFMEEFSRAFEDADVVIVNSIYSAGEEALEGVDAQKLSEMIRNREKKKTVYYAKEMLQAAKLAYNHAAVGDVVVTMGAGDIGKAGRGFLELVEKRGGKTSFSWSG